MAKAKNERALTASEIYVSNIKDLLKALDNSSTGTTGDTFTDIAAAHAEAKSPKVAFKIEAVRQAASNLSLKFQRDISLIDDLTDTAVINTASQTEDE